jgi:hypothetical protein
MFYIHISVDLKVTWGSTVGFLYSAINVHDGVSSCFSHVVKIYHQSLLSWLRGAVMVVYSIGHPYSQTSSS